MFYLLNVIIVQWVTIAYLVYTASKNPQNNDAYALAATKKTVMFNTKISAANTSNIQQDSDSVHGCVHV